MNVLVVGGSHNYYRPFAGFGEYSEDLEILSGSYEEVRDNISLVLFTGGEDVLPSLYGETANKRTSFNSYRDKEECFAFLLAKAYNLPMVGVCRGAQFLCVMAGGRLVQHVSNHGGYHPVKLWDGRVVEMSSTHHQMQLPPKDAKILGWMDEPVSPVHLDGNNEEIDVEREVEVAYYPNIHALGMQYHPEFMDKNSRGFHLAAELVETWLMSQNDLEKTG